MIDSALDSIRLAADTKRIDIRRRIDHTASVVNGDAARLHQVVNNLLTNAVKFTSSGGWIEVRLERSDGRARISVEDNGQGISPTFLPYVFERFRQADGSSNRSQGGLGLGLAIVRHLIDLHGGSVHAASPGPGRGSTFSVEIPLLQGETVTGAVEAPYDATQQLRRALIGVRVLIVDDEADSRDLITHLLERAGATITAAASAADALEVIDALRPNVLVSDVGMPHQDGYELIAELRLRGSPMADIPALAVTAYARPEDRERALAAGFQAHVPKPIVPHDLIASIARLATIGRK